MKRTTMFMPETLDRDLHLYARKARKPVASVVREAVAEYLTTRHETGRLPSFAGVGKSGRSDVAERHEALLFTNLEPHGLAPAARSRRGRRPR